jgi:hypothetical protein
LRHARCILCFKPARLIALSNWTEFVQV